MQTPIHWKMGQVLFLTLLVFGLTVQSGAAPQAALAQEGDPPDIVPTETATTAPATVALEIEEPAATATLTSEPSPSVTSTSEPTTPATPTVTIEPTVALTVTETVEPTPTPLPTNTVEPAPPAASPTSPAPVVVEPVDRPISGPPLLFVENTGHYPASTGDEPIRFQANSPQGILSLTDTALWFTILDTQSQTPDPKSPIPDPTSHIPHPTSGLNLKLTFPNANPHPRIEPFHHLDTTVSYFIGNDPARWGANVPVWGGVRYVDLYPGLDLEISSDNGQLVQRLVIKDGTVAAQMAGDGGSASAELSLLAGVGLHIEGAEAMAAGTDGSLHLTTAMGEVTLPLLQVITPDGTPVDLSATTSEVHDRDMTAPFTAEPYQPGPPADVGIAAAGDLVYSTFIGGTPNSDSSQDIALDGAGNVYITGRAYIGFPSTPGVFDPTIEGNFTEGFVARLTPDGSGLVYATFIGGSNFDWTFAIDVDPAGNAYVTGFTGSADFPATPGAFDNSLASELDIFAAKINPTGTALLYATLLGGNGDEYGYDIAVDDSGSAYVTGFTRSTDFPTTAGSLAPQFNGGFSDGYLVKLAPDGRSLVYGTYLGGSADELGEGLAVDSAGQAYVTGYTSSSNFPTTAGAWDTSMAVADAYVLKLNTAGSGLVYGTFVGGSFAEAGRAVVLDSAGSAYVTGRTDSLDFPTTPDAFDTTHNSSDYDAFVAKLTPDGTGLFYGTYLGGSNSDEAQDLAVDAAGNVYVTGWAWSRDFPTTPDAYASICAGCSFHRDVFIARLNSTGTALTYGTYLGGDSDDDQSYGIAQDGTGHVYVTGDARSADFPTTSGAFDTTLAGFSDGFVAKLFIGTGTEPTPSPLPAHSCAPTLVDTFTVQNEPRGLAVDATRQRLYVANFRSSSVSVVNTDNDQVLRTISGIDSANGLAHDSIHNVLWVTNYNGDQVTPIQANDDATGFTVLPSLSVGDGPWGVVYDPVHDFVYVANNLSSSVTVIDATSRTVVTTLSGSFSQPFHLAANPLTGKVYVSNFGSASVTILNGTAINRVVNLYDSGQPYGIAVDEVRNLVYVATVGPHRIVALGPIRGVADQFLGWAAFNRGFGNPRRPVPLRVIAVNPGLGPSFDGGHLWTTTSTGDASEADQALLIPKGWDGRFHIPFVTNVGEKPGEGLAIDRLTNRVYVAGGLGLGTITVLGDSATLCPNAFAHTAGVEEDVEQPEPNDSNQIGLEFFAGETTLPELPNQPDAGIPAAEPDHSDGQPPAIIIPVATPAASSAVVPQEPRPTVAGVIRLQGRTDNGGTRLFLSEQPCGLPVIQTGTVATTDGHGSFNFETATGSGSGYLCAVQPGYLIGQQDLTVANWGELTLLGGDLTGDNQIDLVDAVMFASRYGTTDPTADLNADGRVDIVDLVMIAGNYGRQGPAR